MGIAIITLSACQTSAQTTSSTKPTTTPPAVRPVPPVAPRPTVPPAKPQTTPAVTTAPRATSVPASATSPTVSSSSTGIASSYTANADAETATAQQQANQAAFESGQLAGATSVTQQNINGRLAMVQASLQRAQHPKKYTAVAAHVALDDPFAEKIRANPLELSLTGTALQYDTDRGIAKIGPHPETSGCLNDSLKPGDYPLLADGNLIDAPERLKQFFVECKASRSIQVIRGTDEVVSLR